MTNIFHYLKIHDDYNLIMIKRYLITEIYSPLTCKLASFTTLLRNSGTDFVSEQLEEMATVHWNNYVRVSE